MAKIVKGTFIVIHEDDKASEIDKFVVVLELNHASVFGDDATFEHDEKMVMRLIITVCCYFPMILINF